MRFSLVLLTEHKILHRSAPNAVCRCLVEGSCTRRMDSLQQTIDTSKFPTLVGKCIQQLSCTIPLRQIKILKIRIGTVWCGETRMVWLPDGDKSLRIRLAVSIEYRRVTDRQTDRRTDGHLATA